MHLGRPARVGSGSRAKKDARWHSAPPAAALRKEPGQALPDLLTEKTCGPSIHLLNCEGPHLPAPNLRSCGLCPSTTTDHRSWLITAERPSQCTNPRAAEKKAAKPSLTKACAPPLPRCGGKAVRCESTLCWSQGRSHRVCTRQTDPRSRILRCEVFSIATASPTSCPTAPVAQN